MNKNIELNQHAKWRFEIAKKIFLKVKKNKKLVSFFVGGSVARNFADEFSDLEICFVWKTVISIEERQNLFQDQDFRETILKEVNNNIPFEDTLYLEDLQIDIWHITKGNIENTIQDVIVNFEVDTDKLILIETFQSCLPLYGQEYIDSIKDLIFIYPKVLAKKIIQKNIQNFFIINMEMYLERNNLDSVYRNIIGYKKLLILVLEAINYKYHVGFKRMDKTLETLEVLPNNIKNTFEEFYKFSPKEAWKKIYNLKLETIDLIKIHFPEIDIEFIENNKKNKRPKLFKTSIN